MGREPHFIRCDTRDRLYRKMRELSCDNFVPLGGPTELFDGTLLQAVIPAELIYGRS